MKKKILILIMAVILAVSIPVFAEESAETNPGIKPDSPLYILDRLVEKIQIAMITDAVKEAEALAGMAQERLAESKSMIEANNVEKATIAMNEYKTLMGNAIDVIDAAAKDGKAVDKTIDKIEKYDIEDEVLLEKLMDKIPAEYKEEFKKAIEALPEKETLKPEDNDEKEEQAEKASAANAILTGKIQDKALLEKIQNAGLNNRQIAALVSLSEQSKKDLKVVTDLFLNNSKGIGKTIIELNLTPKDAIKNINKTFKELKKEIKSGVIKSGELNKEAIEKVGTVEEDKNAESSNDKKESAKLEKKLDKAAEKLEKKIEKTEKKYEKKFDKNSNEDDHDDDHDDDNNED